MPQKNNINTVDVCFSPQLLNSYAIEDSIVVVVDIFRATSTMVTAFWHGIQEIIPVSTIEECGEYKKRSKNYLIAAERDAKTPEGFDLDNSPFSYMNREFLKNKSLIMTTTNGTLAINLSKQAFQVVIGSFLNIEALVNHLTKEKKDVLIVCAGWKGKPNKEDTLFAGALVKRLAENAFTIFEDAASIALSVYELAKNDNRKFLENSSHIKRLKSLGIHKDIDFCLELNKYPIVPILYQDSIKVV